MHLTDAFAGLECLDCGAVADATETTHRCGRCGGFLEPTYDYDAIDLGRDASASRSDSSMWRYADLLPFDREVAVTIAEAGTPLVECPKLAGELGVASVRIKDEGRNPTGSVADRGQSLAVTAAREHGVSAVALPSTDDSGQSAAAYAARAGLESHVYLPSRSGFTAKAMVNVHGGDMTVVGGRFDDAVTAYEGAIGEHEDWYSLRSFETPYRHEGAKTLFYEIVEALAWEVPDAVVVPVGDGGTLVGAYKAARELCEIGLVDDLPRLYAAQASGCAPIVEAFEAGRDEHEPVEYPDTICGSIEVPDPIGGAHILDALSATDGGAVATDDPDVLEAAAAVARSEGLELDTTGGAAASGAWELAERGAFDRDETVVLVNTGAGSKEADVLRSHLMGQGV